MAIVVQKRQWLFLALGISRVSRSSHSDPRHCAPPQPGLGPAPSHPWRRGSPEQLAASRIREEVPDLEPGLLPHLHPQNLPLGLPAGAVFEEVLPCLCLGPVRAPQAVHERWAVGWLLAHFRLLAGEAAIRIQPVEPRGEPLGATGHRPIRPLFGRQLVLPAGGPASFPVPCFDPPLLLSEISRLRCARDLGGGVGHTAYRSESRMHPFHPRASGLSGAALRRIAMRFLAWIA